jgi:MFS transporter, PHS family, inorganic phosphate transporter
MYGSIEHHEEYSVSIGDCDVSKASFDRSSTTSCSTAISEEATMLMYPPIDEQQRRQPAVSTFLFQLLGFPSNPLLRQSPSSPTRNNSAADMRLAMLSQFSTAYNILSISLALQLLESSKVSKSLCSSALIAGMIVGQCGGGTLGDMVGRHVAMAACMGLQVVGALGSATSAHVLGLDLYTILAAWRFVLGLGCGGVYPLAATMTAESSTTQSPKMVALTFSMQGVGYLVVPGVAWVLVQWLPPAVVWRILLGLGSVPGIVLTVGRLPQQRWYGTKQQQQQQQQVLTPTTRTSIKEQIEACPGTPRRAPVSVWDAISMEENLVIKLLGTAGCWFLFGT